MQRKAVQASLGPLNLRKFRAIRRHQFIHVDLLSLGRFAQEVAEPASPTPSYPKQDREIPAAAKPELFPHAKPRARWRQIKNSLSFLRRVKQLEADTTKFDAKAQGHAIYKGARPTLDSLQSNDGRRSS